VFESFKVILRKKSSIEREFIEREFKDDPKRQQESKKPGD
jgi:hypothetical protein